MHLTLAAAHPALAFSLPSSLPPYLFQHLSGAGSDALGRLEDLVGG